MHYRDIIHRSCQVNLLLALAILILSLVLGHPASAQPVADADDPNFEHALALWLNSDEEAALAALRDLAHASNISAQILLGLIDKTAALQGPYLSFLPRTERLALIRAPSDGLSGRSWMHDAAAHSALAQNWIDLWQMQGREDIARRFSDLGEERAIREALLILASRTDTAFEAALMEEPWYPSSLGHLTLNRVLAREDAAQLHPGDPLRHAAGLSVADADLQVWLQESPLALPLRAACDETCAENGATCTLALYHGLASYHALLVMGSPVAGLVSDAEFAQSRRGIAAVARRIMLNHSARTRDAGLAAVAEIDICAADWLREEFRRYYPRTRDVKEPSD